MENNKFECVLSKVNLIKLIEKYYAENERIVSVEIDYDVEYHFSAPCLKGSYNAKTIIRAYEDVSIAGMKLTKKFDLSIDEVKDIVKEVFEKDGYEFLDLINNASTKESLLNTLFDIDDGRKIINKSFTVHAKVMEDNKVFQKKKENNN